MSYIYVLKIALFSLISVLILTPLVIKIAKKINAIDVPLDDRRMHKKPIPRLGGLAIYLSFLFSISLFADFSNKLMGILIGSIFLILTGIVDDIDSVSSKKKFLCQIVASLMPVLIGNITLNEISVLGIKISFGAFSIPLTIFFMVACINMINLIDGLDGLASGVSLIFFMTVAIIAIIQGRSNTLELFLVFSMLGATLGFLKYNFSPAQIFLGDTGSMFLGYMIAIISLLGHKGTIFKSIIIPIGILAIPIIDTTFAIIRRKIKGVPIFEADKNHLHHQLIKRFKTHKKAVLVVYLINSLFSLATIFTILNFYRLGLIVYGILTLIFIIIVFSTNIIFDRRPN